MNDYTQDPEVILDKALIDIHDSIMHLREEVYRRGMNDRADELLELWESADIINHKIEMQRKVSA